MNIHCDQRQSFFELIHSTQDETISTHSELLQYLDFRSFSYRCCRELQYSIYNEIQKM